MNGLSLRWRLTLWYIAVLSLVMLAFGVAMYAMIRSHLLALVDADLVEESKELAEEIEFTRTEQEFRDRFQQHYAEHGGFSFQVSRMDGTVLMGSPWLRAHKLPRPASSEDVSYRTLQNLDLPNIGRHRLLARVARGPTDVLLIHVITPFAQFEREMQSFLTMLLTGGVLSLTAAIVGAHVIARRAMLPIHRMTSTAERISSENLSERIPVANRHDELGRLATTLNGTFDRLKSSIDGMRRFTADDAHELRTPLAVIRTEAEVSLRGESSREHFRHVAEVAVEQTTRLSNLVDQLLTLSRQDAGLQLLNCEEVAIKALVLDVVDTLRVTAVGKSVRLHVGDLPDATVQGDDIALSQLFFNLIDNAIKFTPAGGCVNVFGSVDGRQLKVIVEDNGVGIASPHLPHLFERFYRIDTARTGGGTGLGLAICQSIIDAHRGEIRVESELGKGTSFTVFLPFGSQVSTFDNSEHSAVPTSVDAPSPNELPVAADVSSCALRVE